MHTAMIDDRIITDSSGLEWEIIDESAANDVRLALECDYMPQRTNPGLIFVSSAGLRRVYPQPKDWRTLPDVVLEVLCSQAPRL